MFICADAIDGLRMLADNSVDMCVTSPPYYGLRDYGVAGQIGLEKTPEEYIEKLVSVFREVRRVLKHDGTLWVNIADSYAGSGKGRYKDGVRRKKTDTIESEGQFSGILHRSKISEGYKRKDMLCIPFLLAIALRSDGWYLRQDIIWNKPNCMPESVKDRCTRSHEYIFLLSKSTKYHFDSEAIKEPAVGFDMNPPAGSRGTRLPNTRRRKGNSKTFRGGGAYTGNRAVDNSADVERKSHGNSINKSGLRNRRDVWSVATQGCMEAHFATYPPALIEPCILAGCPVGGTVLDPFLGSGTTALVSNRLGRNCIGIEINPAYLEITKRRLNDQIDSTVQVVFE